MLPRMLAGWSADELLHEVMVEPREAYVPLPDTQIFKRPGLTHIMTPSLRQGGLNDVSFTDLADAEGDALTTGTVLELQRRGQLFAGAARWRGLQVMRLSVCNYQTDIAQAEIDVVAIVDAYRAVRARNAAGGLSIAAT